ncbi:MAG: hypothetical protein EHM71_16495 [Zetaproteobacteria bacterium]|nr:MAG: hypothetical protein EHM71_16495 [Zetaproteobacteria bacterium]
MRLIMLAAGRGIRLGRLTDGVPKPLLALPDGTTILERNIRAMEAVARIEGMLLVSGYAAEMIDAASLRLRMSKSICVQYNPFYRVSGPVVSVWLTRVQMTEKDFLLCNGDTVYGSGALASLAEGDARQIALGVDRRAPRRDDDMKVQLERKGNLRRVGKDIPRGCAHGVSTGLLAVRGLDLRRAFVAEVCDMIREQGNLRPSVAWHSILNALVRKGVSISTVDLDGRDWHEVDTAEDLRSPRIAPVRPGLQLSRQEGAREGQRSGKTRKRSGT